MISWAHDLVFVPKPLISSLISKILEEILLSILGKLELTYFLTLSIYSRLNRPTKSFLL